MSDTLLPASAYVRIKMLRFSGYVRGVRSQVGLLLRETWVGGGAAIAESRLYVEEKVKVIG